MMVTWKFCFFFPFPAKSCPSLYPVDSDSLAFRRFSGEIFGPCLPQAGPRDFLAAPNCSEVTFLIDSTEIQAGSSSPNSTTIVDIKFRLTSPAGAAGDNVSISLVTSVPIEFHSFTIEGSSGSANATANTVIY